MISRRLSLLQAFLICATLLVLSRLFYWQVVAAEKLASLGEFQHLKSIEISAKRGEIQASDGFPLVTNAGAYLIYAYTPQLTKSPEEIAALIAPIFTGRYSDPESSQSANLKKAPPEIQARDDLTDKLSRTDVNWIPLIRNASFEEKKQVEQLGLKGVGIEASLSRDYPEASMAANTLGFVGRDAAGNPKGYFGLEGYYDLELSGRQGMLKQEKDATGKPIIIGQFSELAATDGRDLVLSLDRAIQRMAEKALIEGIKKYQAKSGEVVIMDPKTGAILSIASFPGYHPARFNDFTPDLYKNPVVAEAYEPGSTFKVLTMAAALDAEAVKPETKCDICNRQLDIGSYTIRTWNEQYYPDSTMTEVIQHSDNIGMVFVARKLGKENLYRYLTKFGIGEKTGIDLEEESAPPLRPLQDWKEVDLATASFGQGIAVTGIQMLRAVAAIANHGLMPSPKLVEKIVGEREIELQHLPPVRVISEEAASMMTAMLVNAVDNGEARWVKPKGYAIAGKTGTAQIPVAGHYDEEKTIASFIGFAPAEDPKFVMLVKLREPQTSPWGSETAAPLWFSLSKDLLYYFNVQPKQ